ncbi:hypothetical protein ACE2AJ_07640 [Aquihabitans daechungensis]|uniref:hypothetical protein n=1 Tax=Aquihabitans daechungensis TaxID=1052257 RepID=UPI003BA2EA0F
MWAAGLVVIALGAALLLRHFQLTVTDRTQQHPLLWMLAKGDLAGAYDVSPTQTSPPGFGWFGLPFYGPLRLVFSPSEAFDVISVACLVPLGIATIAASRVLGVAARSGRELASVAAVVLGLPTIANYIEAFHPADVLATAAVLGGFVALARRRPTWSFVLLGFAVATRQWAVVPVAVLAVLVPGEERWRLVLGSIGVAVVLTLPFFLASPDGVMEALAARDVVRGEIHAVLVVSGNVHVRYLLSRVLPLALAALWCAALVRRRAAFAPEVAVGALAVALLLRPLVDPGAFLYYLGPGYAFAVLLGPRSVRWPAIGGIGSWVLWHRYRLQSRWPALSDDLQVLAPGLALSVATTLLVLAAVVAAARRTLGLVAAGSGEAAARGPGDPQPGDGVLGRPDAGGDAHPS